MRYYASMITIIVVLRRLNINSSEKYFNGHSGINAVLLTDTHLA